MKILLKISYVGTAYCGFQAQDNGTAVQNVMTEAAKNVFGEDCNVTGCSRTDAGVHARGFCLTVAPVNMREGWCTVPTDKIHRAFARFLPDDIAVLAAAEVPDDFHPRYSAKGKRYVYRIWNAPWDNPFEFGRVAKCGVKIDGEALARMQAAAEYYVGRHDFRAFMGSGSKITDTNRTVFSAGVEKKENVIEFSVSADGFLYNMVRIMAGTLLLAAAGKIKPEEVASIIESGDRKKAGVTAPPEGLYLDEVFYEESINWECR